MLSRIVVDWSDTDNKLCDLAASKLAEFRQLRHKGADGNWISVSLREAFFISCRSLKSRAAEFF